MMDSLASLGRASFDFFDRVVRTFAAPPPTPILSPADNKHPRNHAAFLQEFQRFRIWAVDLGLLVPGHGSLDYRLRDADNLKSTVHSFLEDLNLYLQETLEFASPDSKRTTTPADATDGAGGDSFNIEDSESTSESDDGVEKEPQWYIDISLDSIADVVDRLYKLSTLIRNPATRLVSSKANHHQEIDPDSGADLIDAFSHSDHDYVLSVFRAYHKQLSEEVRKEQSFPDAAERHPARVWHHPDNCIICNTNYISTNPVDSNGSDEEEVSTRWVQSRGNVRFLGAPHCSGRQPTTTIFCILEEPSRQA